MHGWDLLSKLLIGNKVSHKDLGKSTGPRNVGYEMEICM